MIEPFFSFWLSWKTHSFFWHKLSVNFTVMRLTVIEFWFVHRRSFRCFILFFQLLFSRLIYWYVSMFINLSSSLYYVIHRGQKTSTISVAHTTIYFKTNSTKIIELINWWNKYFWNEKNNKSESTQKWKWLKQSIKRDGDSRLLNSFDISHYSSQRKPKIVRVTLCRKAE